MKVIPELVLKRLLLILLLVGVFLFINRAQNKNQLTSKINEPVSWWEVQSIDAMKYSRDLSREKLDDITFDQLIAKQVKNIAQTGATHIAIGTPYDSEFSPFLQRWVGQAREYGLNVWFRGNWSGWEQWFDYPAISREEHIKKTKQFILQNRNLFKDGDIFTPCPECENGGPGDPRRTKDLSGHREFLIQEYQVTREAFNKIGKKVKSNFNSMNGDVARLVMDQETTRAMNNVVVIDHYVSSVDALVKDIQAIALQSKGKIVLGEFGAPIIDIHGKMSEQDQAEWISEALNRISEMPEVLGLNYWVNVGSSTQLWNKDGTPRQAVEKISSFYTPQAISGLITDQLGHPIANAKIYSTKRNAISSKQGEFQLPYRLADLRLTILADGFKTQELIVSDVSSVVEIKLIKEREGLFFKLRKFIQQLFPTTK